MGGRGGAVGLLSLFLLIRRDSTPHPEAYRLARKEFQLQTHQYVPPLDGAKRRTGRRFWPLATDRAGQAHLPPGPPRSPRSEAVQAPDTGSNGLAGSSRADQPPAFHGPAGPREI